MLEKAKHSSEINVSYRMLCDKARPNAVALHDRLDRARRLS
jgi:hypothetical protein